MTLVSSSHAESASTFKEYPPSQAGGSFGIEKAFQMLEAGSHGAGK
jgi:hypothetical protein